MYDSYVTGLVPLEFGTVANESLCFIYLNFYWVFES